MVDTFRLMCADCIEKESAQASPQVKCWSACDQCGTVANLYLVAKLDPLDARIHTARINLIAATVVLFRRNGRKTTLETMDDCLRWLDIAREKAVATRQNGTMVIASFLGEIYDHTHI